MPVLDGVLHHSPHCELVVGRYLERRIVLISWHQQQIALVFMAVVVVLQRIFMIVEGYNHVTLMGFQ